MMKTFNIGDKVRTPHGTGTIKGFAATDLTGDEVYITDHIGNNRVIIRLHKGHTWFNNHMDYCAFPKDVEVIDSMCSPQEARNANLIASAPDLKECLQDLCKAYRMHAGLDGAFDTPLVNAEDILRKLSETE